MARFRSAVAFARTQLISGRMLVRTVLPVLRPIPHLDFGALGNGRGHCSLDLDRRHR